MRDSTELRILFPSGVFIASLWCPLILFYTTIPALTLTRSNVVCSLRGN
jgi:hypothetical protein